MKHLKLLLKTLISNNACVEAARTKEVKYNIISIVFAILAVFFAVLPLNINVFKQSGSDWLNGTVICNIDTGFQDFSNRVRDPETGHPELTIVEDSTTKKHHLEVKNWNFNDIDPDATYVTDLPRFISRANVSGAEKTILEIYVNTTEDEAAFIKYAQDLLNNVNPYHEDQRLKPNDSEGKEVKRSSSLIIFGRTSVYGYMFQVDNPNLISSSAGDYDSTKAGNLLDTLCTDNPTDTMSAWKTFFNETFVNIRAANAWRTTGIMVGVDFGVIIFMGLMVFILTRGKNNPFRIYSFWDSQKIAYFACLTPGILALLGFLIANMAMMFFILFVGVRVMWLSMRTLRPQAPAK